MVSNIRIGDEASRSKDVLGRVYEYFLSQFASAEGKKGGEFYTPRSVVRLLVEMLEPYNGRVYDPCCGSSGMFVQSVEFIRAHATGNGNGGKAKADISIYGQESNYTTWRLAKMNLAIRGIEGQIAHGDSFRNDRHPDLRADYILANPPFNISDWGGELLQDDKRWQYGVPPKGNANFAWVQHMAHHLAPNGIAGFVLANGSMSSNQSGEGEIRKGLIEAGLVDCMVALPGQLFYSTQIPACLWFLTRDRRGGRHRDRQGEVLFVDARKMGRMTDRTHRELTDDDIARIAGAYHAWRGEEDAGVYADVPGFCKSATLEEVRKHGHVAVRALSQAFALAVPHEETTRIRDDVGFFQAVRAQLMKRAPGEARAEEDLDLAVRQIISRAVASEGVMDIFAAAGAGQAGHLSALGRVPGRGAGDAPSQPGRGAAAEAVEGRGHRPTAEERGAGPLLLGDAGADAPSLSEPGDRGGAGHRGADPIGQGHARGQRPRRAAWPLRGRVGLLRCARDERQRSPGPRRRDAPRHRPGARTDRPQQTSPSTGPCGRTCAPTSASSSAASCASTATPRTSRRRRHRQCSSRPRYYQKAGFHRRCRRTWPSR